VDTNLLSHDDDFVKFKAGSVSPTRDMRDADSTRFARRRFGLIVAASRAAENWDASEVFAKLAEASEKAEQIYNVR